MEIKVNIEKRHFWILALLVLGIGLVIAYGSNNPQIFGHSAEEIDVELNGNTIPLQEALDTLSGSSDAGNSQVITGTYVGDGTDERFISVPGITYVPSMVWIVRDGGPSGNPNSTYSAPPFYRIEGKNLHSDTSGASENWKWIAISPSSVGNNLLGSQQGNEYGFFVTNQQFGPSFTTNTNGFHYSYFVIVPF